MKKTLSGEKHKSLTMRPNGALGSVNTCLYSLKSRAHYYNSVCLNLLFKGPTSPKRPCDGLLLFSNGFIVLLAIWLVARTFLPARNIVMYIQDKLAASCSYPRPQFTSLKSSIKGIYSPKRWNICSSLCESFSDIESEKSVYYVSAVMFAFLSASKRLRRRLIYWPVFRTTIFDSFYPQIGKVASRRGPESINYVN